MRTSILVVALGGLVTSVAAQSTVIETDVITITSCGPEHPDCPGKTQASTSAVVTLPASTTETFTAPTPPCTEGGEVPPASSVTVPVPVATVTPVCPGAANCPPAGPSSTLSTTYVPVETPTYPIVNASSSVPTPVATVTPACPGSPECPAESSTPSTPAATVTPTCPGAPNCPPAGPSYPIGNGTSPSTGPTATGSVATSVVVVPASSSPAAKPSTSTPAVAGAGRMAVSGFSLGLLAVAAAFLG